MTCKFIIAKDNALSRIGLATPQKPQYLCALKLDSEKQTSIICTILGKKGIEGAYVSDSCPFGVDGNRKKCPFYMA